MLKPMDIFTGEGSESSRRRERRRGDRGAGILVGDEDKNQAAEAMREDDNFSN